MSYNVSETIGQSVDIYEIFDSINTVSNGWLVGLILIAVYFLVVGLVISRSTWVKANVYANFVTFLLALLFWALEMISWVYAVVFLAMLMLYLFSLFTTGDV